MFFLLMLGALAIRHLLIPVVQALLHFQYAYGVPGQGSLTEGEDSVHLTSLLR
jgi:hypothetical protein